MKKLLSIVVVAFMATMGLYAYDFKVDGIYYIITDYYDSEVGRYERCASVCAGDVLYSGVVTIPPSVTYNSNTYTVNGIAGCAFENSARLTSVSLPSSIKGIGSYAFRNCKMLTDITLPERLTDIGYDAFEGCASLTKIILPDSITNLTGSLFGGCSALTEVTLPNNLTTLPSYMFNGCSNLMSITLPHSITELGEGCFWDCTRLTHISLPANLQRIGGGCFTSTGVTELTIPASVTYIGDNIFCNDAKIQVIYMQGATAPLLENSSLSCNGQPTIYITCGARADYQSMWGTDFNFVELNTDVSFKTAVEPEGTGYITMQGDCDASDITLTAQSNAGYAFLMWSDGVTSPTRIVHTSSTQTYTAMYAKALHYEVYGVADDGNYTWIEDQGYAIPNSSVEIKVRSTWEGSEVFYQWQDGDRTNPRTTIITQDTTFYAYYTVGGMVGDNIVFILQRDTLQLTGTGDTYDGTTRIPAELSEYLDWQGYMWYILSYQANAISLSEGITSIGNALFYDMQTLTEATIPSSITEIRARAFEDCRKLRNIQFAGKSQLQTIGDWAFYNCHNLCSLTLPEGLTSIGDGAFYGCANLSELTLPSTTTYVADNAFALCSKLQKMHVKAAIPPRIDKQTFENVNREIPVYVPAEAVEAYQSDIYWKEFNIQNDATGIDNTIAGSNTIDTSVRKVFFNGRIYVLHHGKIYTATGIKVK